MKNIRLLTPGFAMFFMASLYSCAPRYGAHFQTSSDGARFYSPAAKEEQAAEPQDALASIARDPITKKGRVQEQDKVLMDKLVDLQNKITPQHNASEKRKVQKEKEALVLEAVKSKLGSMSAAERKDFGKKVKQLAEKKKNEVGADHTTATAAATQEVSESTLLLVLITILVPPLGVYLYEEEINEKFWIALVLTLLFYVPGLIYSLIVILD